MLSKVRCKSTILGRLCTAYRYPLGGGGGENDGDDIDLMIYPDAADVPTATIHLDAATDRTRSVHLPLWSDLGMASAHAADSAVAGGGIGGEEGKCKHNK